MQPVRDDDDRRHFVRRQTRRTRPPLVPEVELHLATEVTPLWEASERLLREIGVEPPFWAFAWAGGQALARHILDNRELVRDRHVIDVGTGSGIVAIAAALAGARRVTAVDLDPVAVVACAENAALAKVSLDTLTADASTVEVPSDAVVLCGDVCYARDAAAAIVEWFTKAVGRGIPVLVGDPGRAYLPRNGLIELACHRVPTSTEIEAATTTVARVWRVYGGI